MSNFWRIASFCFPQYDYFSLLQCYSNGNHPQIILATFGYKRVMELESCLNPSILCDLLPPPNIIFVFSFVENFPKLVIGGRIFGKEWNSRKNVGGFFFFLKWKNAWKKCKVLYISCWVNIYNIIASKIQ